MRSWKSSLFEILLVSDTEAIYNTELIRVLTPKMGVCQIQNIKNELYREVILNLK